MAGLHGSLSHFLAVIVGGGASIKKGAAYAIAATTSSVFALKLALHPHNALWFLIAWAGMAALLQIEEMRGYFGGLGKIKAVK